MWTLCKSRHRGGGYLGAESYEHVMIFVRDTNQFSFINITLAKEKANFPW